MILNNYNELNKSIIFFKQSIIMSIVTMFLFILSIFGNFGVLGVIIGIRTIIMWRSQHKDYRKYYVREYDNFWKISRNDELLILRKDKIKTKAFVDGKFGSMSMHVDYDMGDDNYSSFVFKNLKRR